MLDSDSQAVGMVTGSTDSEPASFTIGVIFVVLIVTFVVFGMNLGQFIYYYVMFPSDRKQVKAIVHLVFILDIAHTCMCIVMTYVYLIQGHGNDASASYIHWAVPISSALENTILLVVQGTCVCRIWLLSERKPRAVVVPVSLTVVRCALGYVAMPINHVWSDYHDSTISTNTLILSLSCSFVDDAVIAGSMVYHLHRRRTGMRGTEYIIRVVTLYAVNCGAVIMLVSLAALLSFVLCKNSFVFGGPIELLCKLFVGSFLANLNSRKTLRDNQPSAIGLYTYDLDEHTYTPSESLSI
ncbi:hypothetical protein C8Q72DRAFT_88926 [Fomitopsis betulina]|nr:hypothetical protein C8Q72DRAFT_88926 [Fomitopsis betulina]